MEKKKPINDISSHLRNVLCLQVFSDEFEQDGRTFHDGRDPRWTALNKNDCKKIFVAIFLCVTIRINTDMLIFFLVPFCNPHLSFFVKTTIRYKCSITLLQS